MNEMNVIGVKKTSFKGNDGTQVDGFNVFVTYSQSNVDGMACERLFIIPRKFVNGIVPKPGDCISVAYNRYGKVEFCEVL